MDDFCGWKAAEAWHGQCCEIEWRCLATLDADSAHSGQAAMCCCSAIGDDVTTYECWLKAEAIERLAADFYARLAQDFAADPEAKQVFLRLAEEETQHAARIGLLRKQYRANHKLLMFGASTGEALAAAHATAETILAEVLAGAWGLDLGAVWRRLSAFEDQLGAAHAHVLADAADVSVKRFFLALTKQDRAHRDLLKPGPPRRALPGGEPVADEWPDQGGRRFGE